MTITETVVAKQSTFAVLFHLSPVLSGHVWLQ